MNQMLTDDDRIIATRARELYEAAFRGPILPGQEWDKQPFAVQRQWLVRAEDLLRKENPTN